MNTTALITLLGGLGFFLLGIHHLTEGLKGLAGDWLRRALQKMVAGRISAVVSGVTFTAIIQSSTAAILTVIGFVSAGLINYAQAVGVIMGATLGTTTTPWMVAIFGFRVRIATFALLLEGERAGVQGHQGGRRGRAGTLHDDRHDDADPRQQPERPRAREPLEVPGDVRHAILHVLDADKEQAEAGQDRPQRTRLAAADQPEQGADTEEGLSGLDHREERSALLCPPAPGREGQVSG